MKQNIDELIKQLGEKLEEVVEKFEEATNSKIFIGISIEKDGVTREGSVYSNDIDWGTACKMLIGINSIVADDFGKSNDK